MGRPLRTFTVLPHLPERLQPLHKLAHNFWWCWNHEAVSLFRRIDDQLFEKLENSPVKLLGAACVLAGLVIIRRPARPARSTPAAAGTEASEVFSD